MQGREEGASTTGDGPETQFRDGPVRAWQAQHGPGNTSLHDVGCRTPGLGPAAGLCCHRGFSLLSQGVCAALTSMPTTSSSPFISWEPGVAAGEGAVLLLSWGEAPEISLVSGSSERRLSRAQRRTQLSRRGNREI